MVSVGRGRGWAQGSLHRPGSTLNLEDTIYVDLVKIIGSVSKENLLKKIDEFAKFMEEKFNRPSFKDIHEKLYKLALNDREFGPKLLMLYHSEAVKCLCDSENLSLYKLLVNRFQVDYQKRQELRQENQVIFRNVIWLFSQFLILMKSDLSRRYLLLQTALLDYMVMLLETTSEEDIKIFTEQVVALGKYFHDDCKQKLNEVMISARQALSKECLTDTSRLLLLYAIDLDSRNYKPLPSNLQKFYKSQLGKDFVEDENNIVNCLSKLEIEHNSKNHYQSNVEQTPGLRAIRGSGAAEVAN